MTEAGLRAQSGTNLKNLSKNGNGTGDNLSPVKSTSDIAQEVDLSERTVQRRNDLTALQEGEQLLERDEILEEAGLRRTIGGNGSNQYSNSNGAESAPLLKSTADIAGVEKTR